MELEIFNCTQGEEDWYAARAGIVTCSELSTVLAKGKGGGDSVTRRKYMLTLAGERIGGPSPFDRYSNGAMQRGHEYEQEARDSYQLITDHEVEQVGFMRRGDVGYSPDGIIGDDGLLEIKTKAYPLHLDCLLKDEVPAEHMAQIQGGLWVSGRQWLDFVSYSPGLPIFIKRVPRDESYIANLSAEVERFNAEVDSMVERIRSYKR
jgi:hypothetical protein